MPERADLVEQRPRVAELDVHGAAVGAGVGERVEQHAAGCRPSGGSRGTGRCAGRSAFTTGGPIVRFGT